MLQANKKVYLNKKSTKNNKTSQFMHPPCNCSKMSMEETENHTLPSGESARLLKAPAIGLHQGEEKHY